jgi:hypothetical protein
MKIEISEYTVLGAITHYKEDKWIDPKGRCGYFRKVKRKYDTPRVQIMFRAKTDLQLEPNGIYTDGENSFLAISENEFVNCQKDLKTFSIPQSLTLIGTRYTEMMKR